MDKSSLRRHPLLSCLMRGLYLLCGVVLLLLALMSYMGVFNGNVRTVEPGRFYRSGQLRGRQLSNVLESNHIKSVINLRGYSGNDIDLNEERSLCRAKGIKHVDIKMSARQLPEPNELNKLIVAFDKLPRPILVHCAGGSDRSGLASALYMNIYEHTPLNKAQSNQLTWRYGHLSFGKAHAMDDFFSLYRKTADGLSIREWIQIRYPNLPERGR